MLAAAMAAGVMWLNDQETRSSYSPYGGAPVYTGNFMCPHESSHLVDGELVPCQAIEATQYLLGLIGFFVFIYAIALPYTFIEFVSGNAEGAVAYYFPALITSICIIFPSLLLAEYFDLQHQGKYAKRLFTVFLVVLSTLTYLLFWKG